MGPSRFAPFVLGLGVALSLPFASADAQVIKINPSVALDPNAKLINISGSTQVFYKGENIKLSVLRAGAGSCSQVRLTLDGKSRTENNVAFPWTFEIKPGDALYPTKSAKLEMVVEGVVGCTGRVAYTFAFNASEQGVVDGIVLTGFGGTTPDAAQAVLQGHGLCMMYVYTYRSPWEQNKGSPYEIIPFLKPTRLPATIPLKRTGSITASWGGDHVFEVNVTGIKSTNVGVPDDQTKKAFPTYEGCVINAGGNGWGVRKTFPTTKAPATQTAGGGAGAAGAGGAGAPPAPKPANGNIVSMLVPGGSFAEDEPQKIQVNGKGGCGMEFKVDQH